MDPTGPTTPACVSPSVSSDTVPSSLVAQPRTYPLAIFNAIRSNSIEILQNTLDSVLETDDSQTKNDLLLLCVQLNKPLLIEYLLCDDRDYRPSTMIMNEVVDQRKPALLDVFLRAEWSEPDLKLGDDEDQGDILHWAIRVGDLDLVEEIVECGVTPVHLFEHKYAHLRSCFTLANLDHGVALKLANYLINADLASTTEPGVLHHIALLDTAVTHDLTTAKIDAVDFLIASGADVHALYPAFDEDTERVGYEASVTPLAVATSRKDFRLVMHMLDRCADPWFSPYRYTACAYYIAKEVQWGRGVDLFEDWEKGYRGTQLGTEGHRPLYRKVPEGLAEDPGVVALKMLGRKHEQAMRRLKRMDQADGGLEVDMDAGVGEGVEEVKGDE